MILQPEIDKFHIDECMKYTLEDFSPEFIAGFMKSINENVGPIDSNIDSVYNSLVESFCNNIDINIITEASDGKKIVKNVDEIQKKSKQAGKEIAEDIKKNGVSSKGISAIMDKIWNKFAIDLDSIAIESILEKDKSFTEAKVKKSIVLFFACALANTIADIVLKIILGPIASIITAVVVAPLVEENAKQIAIKDEISKEFITIFNIGEFSTYAARLGMAGFNFKGILLSRLPAVILHFTTMAIQKLTSNKKINDEVEKTSIDEEDKRKKISFIGHLIGVLIHGCFNFLATKYSMQITKNIINTGGHKVVTQVDNNLKVIKTIRDSVIIGENDELLKMVGIEPNRADYLFETIEFQNHTESITELFGLFKKNKEEDEEEDFPLYIDPEVQKTRKKELNIVINLAKEVLRKYKNPKGIKIGYTGSIPQSDQFDFINNHNDEVVLVTWDAWKGTNNRARDEEFYIPYTRDLVYGKIYKDLKDAINKNKDLHGKLEDDGDWDEGFFYYKL